MTRFTWCGRLVWVQASFLLMVAAAERPFPGRLVADVSGTGEARVQQAGSLQIIWNADGALRIEGRDRGGKVWSFQLPHGGMSTRIWAADLDGNGVTDYLVAPALSAGGDCPNNYLLWTLLRDDRGRPAPDRFEMEFERSLTTRDRRLCCST